MNYTTLEQSKKLIELGLDPNTADMNYRYCICKLIDEVPVEDWLVGIGKPFDECADPQIPCWSLGALIELMPNEITTDELTDTPIEIHKCGIGYQGRKSQGVVYFGEGNSLTNNAVLLVLWLLENGYIKKRGEE
jgi:hypothetical protein